MANNNIKKYEVKLNLAEQAELRSQITELFKADDIKILDNKAYEMIGNVLILAKGKAKDIGDFYKDPKAYAHSIHKEICDMEKEDLEVLTNFEGVAKRSMSDYLLSLEEPKEDEETGEILPAVEVPKVKGISATDIFSMEIVDVNLIPREYLIPNEKMIKEMIKASNGTVKIPGVKIIKDKSISVRVD